MIETKKQTMTASEFKIAVLQEEKIIREARNRLSELHQRAVDELCPVSRGELTQITEGIYVGRPMIVETISIITPLFNDEWVFRAAGSYNGYYCVAFIPFPED